MDNKKEAKCIDDECWNMVTYFWWENKKLKKPIKRCIATRCPLDSLPPKKVNDYLEKRFPIVFEPTKLNSR